MLFFGITNVFRYFLILFLLPLHLRYYRQVMEYRLNKFISGSGYCSRREADRLIEEGRVKVNGRKAVIGMRVLPGQTVQVNGELIKHDIEPVYIAFNKPVG